MLAEQPPQTIPFLRKVEEEVPSSSRFEVDHISRTTPYRKNGEPPTQFELYINERFDKLPPSFETMHYREGEMVLFPIGPEQNAPMAEWKIARAEKGHYLLERTTQTVPEEYARVMCRQDTVILSYQKHEAIAEKWPQTQVVAMEAQQRNVNLDTTHHQSSTTLVYEIRKAMETGAPMTPDILPKLEKMARSYTQTTEPAAAIEAHAEVPASPPAAANDNYDGAAPVETYEPPHATPAVTPPLGGITFDDTSQIQLRPAANDNHAPPAVPEISQQRAA